MMLEAQTRKISDIDESLRIVSNLISMGTIRATENYLRIKGSDAGNTTVVEFEIMRDAFDVYDLEEETSITVNIENFQKMIRKMADDELLEIEMNENKLEMNSQANVSKRFSLPALRSEEEDINTDLNFDIKARLDSSPLSDAVESASIVADSLFLEVNDHLKVEGASGNSDADYEIPVEDVEGLDGVEEPVRSHYDIGKLKKIVKAKNLSDEVELKTSRNFPLQLSYDVSEEVELSVILAPRVD